ncbi:phage portal protein [Microbacterium sp. NPDC089696]|uniref:phage portal protein n=1 Tax=Microbacterium sp. NPDC089696 TaxID=3364199 RepID=UPI00380A52E9
MGFLSEFTARLAGGQSGRMTGDVTMHDGRQVRVSAFTFMDAENYLRGIEGMAPETLWAAQPHLRTVVDFLARQMMQLSLHLYERNADGDVDRVREGPVAEILRRANDEQTFSELIEQLVTEWAVRDDAFVFVMADKSLRVFPTSWVEVKGKYFGSKKYTVTTPEGGTLKFDSRDVIRFKGCTPGNPLRGTSRVETLRLVLEEQFASLIYRKQTWKKGGRFGGFLTRPKDAPRWDDDGRKRFWRMWDAFTGNRGAKAGGTPLLEDGMEWKPAGFSPRENEWAEATQLSLGTVAQVYHVNPTMIGQLDNANFSNVREFRRMLYTDTLGPLITRIEERLTAFLLPLLGAPAGQYLEFNVEAKLRGSFEEQAKVLSAAVGGPWMLRSEARKKFNLPMIEGADELIVPLNVVLGGQASPVDGGAASGQKGIESLSSVQGVVDRFRTRQAEVISAKRGAGDPHWWDRTRWVKELRRDLLDVGLSDGEAQVLADRVNDQAFAHFAAEPSSASLQEVSA